MWQILVLVAVDMFSGAPAAPRSVVPTQIPQIPRSFARQLTQGGCLVPQPEGVPGLSNVVAGAFAHTGQIDIAVLCMLKDRVDIRIHWGGSWHCPSSLAVADTKNYFQSNARGGQDFSRALLVATPEQIGQYQDATSSADLPVLEHSGIDDTFVGKGSEIHYCLDGKWVRFDGAD